MAKRLVAVGTGRRAPSRRSAEWSRPSSSHASRSAVAQRSASAWSRLPPGKAISHEWWRIRSGRLISQTWRSPSASCRGTQTAASSLPAIEKRAGRAGRARSGSRSAIETRFIGGVQTLSQLFLAQAHPGRQLQLAGQGGAGHGAGVGADRAADALADQPGQRMVFQPRHRLALPVGGGAEVQDDALAADALDHGGVARPDHAVRDPLHPQLEGLDDVARLARLAGVAGQMEPGSAGGLESAPVGPGGEAGLVPGQVEADQAAAGVDAGLAGQRQVVLGVVLAQPAGDGHRPQGRRVQPAQDRLDHALDAEATPAVQERRPADLQVVDPLGGGIGAQLVGRPLQRRLRLQDRDHGFEVGDVGGLGGTVGRGHQAQGAGEIEPLLGGQLLRGGGPDRTVEMTVQLGLTPRPEVDYPVARMSLTLEAALSSPVLASSLPFQIWFSSLVMASRWSSPEPRKGGTKSWPLVSMVTPTAWLGFDL